MTRRADDPHGVATPDPPNRTAPSRGVRRTGGGAAAASEPARAVAPSARTTPKTRGVLRPPWNKKLGWSLVGAGLLLIIVNDIGMLTPSATPLPFGHSEAYLFLGVAIAVWGGWWNGIFDRD